MSRLVVISNRVPAQGKTGGAQAGGLAVAMEAALSKQGGIWMGWSGKSSGAKEPGPPQLRDEGGITYALTDLSKNDIDEYYAGFANSVLWPLCHYRLDLTDYARKDMAGYFRVNRFFARQLKPMLKADDVIWVQDYHMIPMASELRQMGVESQIGFFLHIPLPPPDVLFTLPVHETLLRGLAAYDLVGFQTRFDAENFVNCLKRLGVGGGRGDGVAEAYGHRFRVGAFPIGIDTAKFAASAEKAVGGAAVRKIAESFVGRDMILGVDRLDYSKGIPQRIEAFERFVTMNPAHRGTATLLQITPKSRSEVPHYVDIQNEVAGLAGRVNGALGTLDWVPIRYINQSVPHAVLSGIHRSAKVGLVTPMRDGMNLVAKEYVAAQDPSDPGVLVLSRFAGAASDMTDEGDGDGPLLVNPYDTDDVATAIAKALTMPLEARKERYERMMKRLIERDIFWWSKAFLETLARPI